MKRRATRAGTVLAALAAASLLGACASLPTSPSVQQVNSTQAAAGPGGEGARSVPVPPGPDWRPEQIVSGFISACADDPQGVARQYLAPSYRASWHPVPWAATVIDPAFSLALAPTYRVTDTGHTAVVILTTAHLATLNAGGTLNAGVPFEAGQYQVSAAPHAFVFELTRLAEGWRIIHLDSPTLLMLTEPDFVRDYQPRNLYFFAGPSSSVLVPEPVFVPQQATVDLNHRVEGLVKALLREPPTGWLHGAVSSAFPAKTTVHIQVSGGDVVVDLGGAAALTTQWQRSRMAAQLAWTLTNSFYQAPADIHSVVLKFNGQLWRGGSQLSYSSFSQKVPQASNGPLYYQGTGPQAAGLRTVDQQDGNTASAPLPAALGKTSFKVIAVSPGGGSQPSFAGCAGKQVFVTTLDRGAQVRSFPLATPCTALSWDPGGNLWLAAGHTIAVIGPGGALMPVGWPAMTNRDSVIGLRVAPDGVRLALIVSTPAGTKVLMAAINRDQVISLNAPVSVGSDLLNPVSLSWYDADNLVVLDQPGGSSAQIYEVPLDGGASTQLTTPSGATSVTAGLWGVAGGTGPVNTQQIWVIPRPNGQSKLFGAGVAPVFPG